MDSRSKFPTVGFQADISAFADVYFGLRLDFFDAHAMWSCCVIRGKEESATGTDAASFVSARTGAEAASSPGSMDAYKTWPQEFLARHVVKPHKWLVPH